MADNKIASNHSLKARGMAPFVFLDRSYSANLSAVQASALVNNVPLNIHCQIFEYLGPAGQRILGATCISFHETYKEHFFQQHILVNLSELFAPHLIPFPSVIGTVQYIEILVNWLARPTAVSKCDSLSILHGRMTVLSRDIRRIRHLAPKSPDDKSPLIVVNSGGWGSPGMLVMDWAWGLVLDLTVDVVDHVEEDIDPTSDTSNLTKNVVDLTKG